MHAQFFNILSDITHNTQKLATRQRIALHVISKQEEKKLQTFQLEVLRLDIMLKIIQENNLLTLRGEGLAHFNTTMMLRGKGGLTLTPALSRSMWASAYYHYS